ncbi:MAG: hypothetical protein IPJ84_07580 [Bdellovibrionales bacterium]|nr:hypothetical protein [Bdellovibrionales bacterium]
MKTLFFYLILFFSFSEATLAEQPNLRDLPRHPRRVKAGEWARQDILSVDCNGSNNYGKTRFTYSFDDDFSFSVTNNLMGEIRDQYSAPAVDNLKNDNTSKVNFYLILNQDFIFYFGSTHLQVAT